MRHKISRITSKKHRNLTTKRIKILPLFHGGFVFASTLSDRSIDVPAIRRRRIMKWHECFMAVPSTSYWKIDLGNLRWILSCLWCETFGILCRETILIETANSLLKKISNHRCPSQRRKIKYSVRKRLKITLKAFKQG